jgi:hypothetical protein
VDRWALRTTLAIAWFIEIGAALHLIFQGRSRAETVYGWSLLIACIVMIGVSEWWLAKRRR